MSKKQPRVVGLDPSLTSFGIASADGSTSVIKTKLRGDERLQFLRSAVLIHCLGADLVVIEGYSYGSRNKREAMGELRGVITTALYEAHVPYKLIAPTSLKKFATGDGMASKRMVGSAARGHLDLPEGLTSDEYDAAWLRQMGLRHLQEEAT